MSAAVIIPARYGSTRFPGKVLATTPEGKPLIYYVWHAATRARGVDCVIVATDDQRVARAVRAFGGNARITAPQHHCGSDRCAEVARRLDHPIVVNLQGDEPCMPPEMISRTIELLQQDDQAVIATLAAPINDPAELRDPTVVKVVLNEHGHALYFSRSIIPCVRDAQDPLRESPLPHLRHHGIYAFRRPFLLEYARLGPHPLERAESLEQLRALAHGYKIKVGLTAHRSMKVDTPDDFDAFCAAISTRTDPNKKADPA